jgi:hypothetical protein
MNEARLFGAFILGVVALLCFAFVALLCVLIRLAALHDADVEKSKREMK